MQSNDTGSAKRVSSRFLFAAVVSAAVLFCGHGCSEETTGTRETIEDLARADAAAAMARSGVIAPDASDLRIEMVKPEPHGYRQREYAVRATSAQFGWVAEPGQYSPETLFYYAAEKAVALVDPYRRADSAVPYIAGIVPGSVTPYDTFEVSGCRVNGDTVAFHVKYVRGPMSNPHYGALPEARAYYAIEVSALPEHTKVVEIRFENWWLSADVQDGVMTAVYYAEKLEHDLLHERKDIRVEIEPIRCENYFKAVQTE